MMRDELRQIKREADWAPCWSHLAYVILRLCDYIAKLEQHFDESGFFVAAYTKGHDARHNELETRLERLEEGDGRKAKGDL